MHIIARLDVCFYFIFFRIARIFRNAELLAVRDNTPLLLTSRAVSFQTSLVSCTLFTSWGLSWRKDLLAGIIANETSNC